MQNIILRVSSVHFVLICNSRTFPFRKVASVHVEKDEETNISYVKMKNPTDAEISFVRSSCKSKQVMKINCSDLGNPGF